MQLLSAKCRLGMLPPATATSSPQLAHYQPHILPALHDALCGFTRLRCPAQCAQVRCLRHVGLQLGCLRLQPLTPTLAGALLARTHLARGRRHRGA